MKLTALANIEGNAEALYVVFLMGHVTLQKLRLHFREHKLLHRKAIKQTTSKFKDYLDTILDCQIFLS